MIAKRHLDDMQDHIRRSVKASGPIRVRSSFTNCQGTIISENADVDDVRDLLTRGMDFAFESLRCSAAETDLDLGQ
jgi:hypothetical protein